MGGLRRRQQGWEQGEGIGGCGAVQRTTECQTKPWLWAGRSEQHPSVRGSQVHCVVCTAWRHSSCRARAAQEWASSPLGGILIRHAGSCSVDAGRGWHDSSLATVENS